MSVSIISGTAARAPAWNVKSPLMPSCPLAFLLLTRKWYSADGVSPLIVWEWLVTAAPSTALLDPYEVVVPYSTCESEGWSVVHAIVALAGVTGCAFTPLIAGATAGAGGCGRAAPIADGLGNGCPCTPLIAGGLGLTTAAGRRAVRIESASSTGADAFAFLRPVEPAAACLAAWMLLEREPAAASASSVMPASGLHLITLLVLKPPNEATSMASPTVVVSDGVWIVALWAVSPAADLSIGLALSTPAKAATSTVPPTRLALLQAYLDSPAWKT
jgi:hypothetical protein